MSDLKKGNPVLNFVNRYRHKDGSYRWIEWRSQAQDEMLYAIARDVTEVRKTQDALQNFQRLNSLGVLAGGIAHDFNNLLGGILGNIDLAANFTTDSSISPYLQGALKSIDRARSLTGQLLTFAKGGEPVMRTEALDPFIRETVSFALSGSTLNCKIDIPENLWNCSIDKNQIAQVIDNLVINAMQATTNGGLIEVSARNRSLKSGDHPVLKEGDYVVVSIKDEGDGIAQDIIHRIFEPFFTTKTRGHGLGLATSFSILQRHQGVLEVESEEGQGSIFTFYLPACIEAVGVCEEFQEPPGNTGGTIMVLDDDTVLLEILKKMLASLGYESLLVRSGHEALKLLEFDLKGEKRILAMLCDLTMPGELGGKEVIREIRKSKNDLPVIVSSGYADDPIMSNPQHYGFTASICKPYTLQELSGLLKNHVFHG